MQFNFFTWVREGIKQAILLGVSDAVEHLGTPIDGDELNQRLAEALQPTIGSSSARSGSSSRRKRLGRTLKDIESSKES